MKWEMTLTMTPKKQLFVLFASDEHKPVIPIPFLFCFCFFFLPCLFALGSRLAFLGVKLKHCPLVLLVFFCHMVIFACLLLSEHKLGF